MLSNPSGKPVDMTFLKGSPPRQILVKEECNCWGDGKKHWNLLLVDSFGERLIYTFYDERDVDWIMFVYKAFSMS